MQEVERKIELVVENQNRNEPLAVLLLILEGFWTIFLKNQKTFQK